MNTASHLLPEDRPEFERALDEALHDVVRGHGQPRGRRWSAEQLRGMALAAASAITACAAAEYGRFVSLREELRDPANAPTVLPPAASPALVDARAPGPSSGSASESGPGSGSGSASEADAGPVPGTDPEPAGDGPHAGAGEPADGLDAWDPVSAAGAAGGAMSEAADGGGAGLFAMASVLVPVLAGTAALIFLVLGYLLRLLLSPEPAIAAPMRGVGWAFALLAAAAAATAMVGLWLAALRNRPRARRGGAGGHGPAPEDGGAPGAPGAGEDLTEQVAAARAAWREALLDRGILPFLSEALAGPPAAALAPTDSASLPGEDFGTDPDAYAADAEPDADREPDREPGREAEAPERTPRLGYSGPDFSSRSDSDVPEERGVRPRFSSPDFTSPHYGGPDHDTE